MSQTGVVAKPYLRGWKELNDTDVASYQALVDVFHKEGVLKDRMEVRKIILQANDFAI